MAHEEFDREKLARGIRISCAKRPVSAADIERLIGVDVEASCKKWGKPRSLRRTVGDLRDQRLKELDEIAHPLCHCLPRIGRPTLLTG